MDDLLTFSKELSKGIQSKTNQLLDGECMVRLEEIFYKGEGTKNVFNYEAVFEFPRDYKVVLSSTYFELANDLISRSEFVKNEFLKTTAEELVYNFRLKTYTGTDYKIILERLCAPRKVRNVKIIDDSTLYYEFECLKSGNFENHEVIGKKLLLYANNRINGKAEDFYVRVGEVVENNLRLGFFITKFTCCLD